MGRNPYLHDPKDVELENVISRHLHNLQLGDLHVSVKEGHVTVSGMVDDFTTKRQITDVIRGLGGTREITNNARVTGESYTRYDSHQNI